MIHEFKSMASGDGLSAVCVESYHLGLCPRGHDRFDYLCNVRMAPLFGGLAELLDMKKCPPARLHAFDSERYTVLL